MNTKAKRAISHHYVPQWYQRRFIDPTAHPKKLQYLDLRPDRVDHGNGTFHFRRALSLNGPAECFQTDNLYTLRFGRQVTDDLEKEFFGRIDREGQKAVDFYGNYQVTDGAIENFHPLVRYMNAQRWRTPKGLDLLSSVVGAKNDQDTLLWLHQVFELHSTIWIECVWEVLSCDNSPTKFIVSDHPITMYNKASFPGRPESTYPNDPLIEYLGTHTLFPLNLNRCLVLTNLGYVRNPTCNPLQKRENPRYFAPATKDIRTVQTHRQVDEEYVLNINYVLKSRARRYIAAARTEWLYPERNVKQVNWNKIGGRFFLMPDPRKVRFTTGMIASYADGSSWNSDEYGRSMSRDKELAIERLRAREQATFATAKKAWDSAFGELSFEEKKQYW